MAQSGKAIAHGKADARRQPAAAARNHDRVGREPQRGDLLDDLEARRPLARQ